MMRHGLLVSTVKNLWIGFHNACGHPRAKEKIVLFCFYKKIKPPIKLAAQR